jgi:hypothetical protein
METQMLGTVKPYCRQVRNDFSYALHVYSRFFSQVVISTGKSDWDREVTETTGSLAAYLLNLQNNTPANAKVAIPKGNGEIAPSIPGTFLSSDSAKISILNGSHNTLCDDCAQETVLILPDYKVATGVSRSAEGAEDLWKSSIDPSLGRVGVVLEKSPLKTWIVPYSCVILLCK